jgi:hypothetical protein
MSVDIDSVVGLLHCSGVGDVDSVSKVHTTSIFRVKVWIEVRLVRFCVCVCIYIALCFQGGGGGFFMHSF